MVTRTSQEAQFNVGSEPTVQQSGMGTARVDTDKFRTSESVVMPDMNTTSSERILGHLLGSASKLDDQYVSQSREEAYLDGISKATTAKSEADLQGDVFTSAWQHAGYRDTVGRLAAADMDAKVASDMTTMREKSPEDFGKYMAQQRASLVPQFEGMSMEARKSLLTQTMLSERAAIKTHAAEHYKFVVDTMQKVKATGWSGQRAMMDTAKAHTDAGQLGLDAYSAQSDAAFGWLHDQVVTDPNIPNSLRPKMIMDAAENALSGDHHALYNKLRNVEVTKADGTAGTMLGMLTIDDQTKLDKEYRQSLERTNDLAHVAFAERAGVLKSDMGNQLTPVIPEAEFRRHVAEGVKNGYYKAHDVESLWDTYNTSMAKKVQGTVVAQAFLQGNTDVIFQRGSTPQEAAAAAVQHLAKLGVPKGDVVQQLLTYGGVQGNSGLQNAANVEAGGIMNTVLDNLRPGADGMIDKASAESLSKTYSALNNAEAAGNAGAYSAFMQKLTPENATKFVYMREAMKNNGGDANEAMLTANTLMADEAKMTPDQRATVRGKINTENLTFAQGITERGVVSSGWGWVRSKIPNAIGGTDGSVQDISVLKLPFEDQHKIAQMMAPVQLASLEELNIIRTANPHMSIDDAGKVATARVAARTVHTQGGVLVLGRNSNLQTFFGLDSNNVGQDRIGKAIDERIHFDGQFDSVAYQAQYNGDIGFRTMKRDGTVVQQGTFSGREIGPILKNIEEEAGKEHDKYSGRGTTVKHGNAAVQYNGSNTSGVDDKLMYQFRKDTVGFEGVVDTAAPDISGKLDASGKRINTVGVGVSSHNKAYPQVDGTGKVSQQQINDSFFLASNEAASGARRALTAAGPVATEPAFRLMAQLAYQSGPSFYAAKGTSYPDMISAMSRGDHAAAQDALARSPAMRTSNSGEARRKFYSDMLRQAMKG